MLELALRDGNGPVIMRDIAESQDISKKYLHSLLSGLKAAGLVRAVRGSGGGYVLARPPSGILASEVILALEGPFAPVDCVADSSICERTEFCVTRDVWREIGEAIEKILSGITLEQLVARHNSKLAQRSMFHI
jgi:Rrf2 family protein